MTDAERAQSIAGSQWLNTKQQETLAIMVTAALTTARAEERAGIVGCDPDNPCLLAQQLQKNVLAMADSRNQATVITAWLEDDAFWRSPTKPPLVWLTQEERNGLVAAIKRGDHSPPKKATSDE